MTESARRIGRYAIDEVVGAGAFATVYRATDERLGPTVAIKVLADNHCLDPDIRARFIDEGRALRRIESPHVVRAYDAGETEQAQPYLVLDYADRGTLAGRVEELRAGGWRSSADDVRIVVAELAAAIEAVHAAGLVHRDLSPGNVLIRTRRGPAEAPSSSSAAASSLVAADEELLVADLGLAKDLARSSGLTVAGGTDGFRPPEQRGGPARVDARADLWALSAVVFWLLTGRPPGDGDPRSDRRLLAQSLADAGLPPDLRQPVLLSLHDDPAQRHSDVATWRSGIDDALAAAVSAEAEPTPKPPLHQRPHMRRAFVLVTGVVIGIVAAILGGRLTGDDGPTVRELGDGRMSVTETAGDARLTLAGPREATVGTTVTFEATTRDVEEWVWLMPDGHISVDTPTAEIRTQSAGVAEITLLGVTESGERLEVVGELHVTDDG
jgi:eukaryotic-like serine/threonine-protein kinase